MDIKWRKLEQVLNEFADAFIQEARDNLQENKTNASYNLYNSFEKIIDIDQNHFSVKISLADYWVFVENGRNAGNARVWRRGKHGKNDDAKRDACAEFNQPRCVGIA